MYNLTLNGTSKFYATFEEAEKVFNRAMKKYEALTKYHDGCQPLDYMSIDEVKVGVFSMIPVRHDILYVDGAKL